MRVLIVIVIFNVVLSMYGVMPGFIAYDCSSPNNTIAMISTRDIAECPSLEDDYKTKSVDVAIVQRNNVQLQEVKTCLVEITRMITHCGKYSHNSAVEGGLLNYVHELGRLECDFAHTYKYTRIHRQNIYGLVVNSTTSASVTLEGKLGLDGTCSGVEFTEGKRTWTNVVVYATVKIELRTYMAKVKLDENEIILHGGVTCQYLRGYCIDSTFGESTWAYTPENTCNSGFSLLYTGAAEIVTNPRKNDIVVAEQGNNVFAFSILEKTTICHTDVWQSEHPKILIMIKSSNIPFQSSMVLLTDNIDLTAYVNSKLLYIEQAHNRTSRQFYRDTIRRKCLVQREVLRNRLIMSPLSPNAISSLTKHRMGYVGRVLGEVLYIMQCLPKRVEIRRTDKCYHELPISVGNDSYFMSPITHIIQKIAEEIDCNGPTPALYYIDNNWLGLTPYPIIMKDPPQILEVDEHPFLNFKPIQSIGSDGLYTQEEIASIQNILTFGMERTAVGNIIARKMSGMETNNQGYSTVRLFDTVEIEKLAHSTINYMWGWFSEIGIFMSGLIGSYIVFRIVKYAIEVLLNAVALYRTMGCGLSMLASLWNTLAMVTLHRHSRTRKNDVEAPLFINNPVKLQQQHNSGN